MWLWLENGGEVFKLSRVLDHASVTVTEVYSKDFQSRSARAEHLKFSPVEALKKRLILRGIHAREQAPCYHSRRAEVIW
jgi:hypothetical protein